MSSSFLNERSAEAILIPNLINKLSSFYAKITPIYYWSSREGSKISSRCFSSVPIKIIALYARRPKVNYPGDKMIRVKLNQILFEKARLFSSNGIIPIAGVPVANCLDNLLITTSCLYFDLGNDNNECILELELDDLGRISNAVPFIIDIEELLSRIEDLPSTNWENGIKLIDGVRRTSPSGFGWHSFYGDLYKPVYLIVHCI